MTENSNTLLLTIVNLVMKMYRNRMLSAETEVRNGILYNQFQN